MKLAKETQVLVGSIGAYNLAFFSWWTQPEIIHSLISDLGYSESAAGLITSVELIVLALTTLFISRWISFLPIRKLCYGAAIISILCHFASTTAGSLNQLLMFRFFAGCGEGLIAAAALASLASLASLAGSKNPDRSYALLNIWNVSSAVLILFAMSMFTPDYGHIAVFGLIGSACLIIVLLFNFLPKELEPVLSPQGEPGHQKLSGMMILLTIFIWNNASVMLWAYLILVGQQTSLSESTVGNVVAIAAGGGLIGGILAASIGGKITRSKLCNIGLFIEILLVMALTHFFYNWLFIIFAPALIASIYFLLPLYMGMAAESDPSGRLPTMAGGIFLLSGGTGPLLGGYLVESLGVQAIGWAIMAGSLFAMSCIYWLERRKSSG